MNDEQLRDKQVSVQSNVTPPTSLNQQPVRSSSVQTFQIVQKYAAIVMIVSAILFALIGVLATWNVFGDNTGDVIWRAFSSLGIIAFAGLVVNVASRSMEPRR